MTSRFYPIIYKSASLPWNRGILGPMWTGNISSYLSLPAWLVKMLCCKNVHHSGFFLHHLSDGWCYIVREERTSIILAYPASLASFNKRNHGFSFRDPSFPRSDQWGPKWVSERASLRIKPMCRKFKLRYKEGQIQIISWVLDQARPEAFLFALSVSWANYISFRLIQFGLDFCLLQKQKGS